MASVAESQRPARPSAGAAFAPARCGWRTRTSPRQFAWGSYVSFCSS